MSTPHDSKPVMREMLNAFQERWTKKLEGIRRALDENDKQMSFPEVDAQPLLLKAVEDLQKGDLLQINPMTGEVSKWRKLPVG